MQLLAGAENTADLGAAGLIVIAALLVFGSVVWHPFSGFDDPFFVNGPELSNPTTATLANCWMRPKDGLYVPVAHGLVGAGAVNGISAPAVFHLASVLVHVGSALMVYAILRQLGAATLQALAGALIFALHPLQVESVAWASELKDLLAGFFGFSYLLMYIRSRLEPESRDRWQSFLSLAARQIVLTLAALSKPSAVIFPVLAAVIDLTLLSGTMAAVLRRMIPSVAIVIPWVIVGHLVQPGFQTAVLSRPLIAAHAAAFYFRHTLLPIDPVPDYAQSPANVLSAGAAAHLATIAAMLAIAGAIMLRRRGMIPAGLLLLILAPLPALGLVPFDFQRYSTVADHYLYVGLLGAAVLFAAVARHPALLVVPLVAGAASFVDCGRWANDVALWSHNIESVPNSTLALANYGVASNIPGDVRSLRQTIACLQRSIELQEDQFGVHDNLAMFLLQAGDVDGAIVHMKRTIQFNEEKRYGEKPQVEACCAWAISSCGAIARGRP